MRKQILNEDWDDMDTYWDDVREYYSQKRNDIERRIASAKEKRKGKQPPTPESLKKKSPHTLQMWTFDRILDICEKGKNCINFDESYHLVNFNGKWNVLTPSRDYASDIWFDKVVFKVGHINPPFRVKYQGKYNYIDGTGQLLSDIWFAKAEPYFKQGWVIVRVDADGGWYWMNEQGEIFDDDGTPYGEERPEENINAEITESLLKKIIYESIKEVFKKK